MAYVTLYPTGASRPNASVLNDLQGAIVTNSAIVPSGTVGGIDVYTEGAHGFATHDQRLLLP